MNFHSFECLLCILPFFALGTMIQAKPVDYPPLGQFEQQQDIGDVNYPGATLYDPVKQEYVIQGSGTNMWGNHDEFHYVWKRMKGDFVLQTMIEFLGKGDDLHRKAGIIVRKSLDPRSPHINACNHGDGLTSLQFRRTEGGSTEEMRFDSKGQNVLELSRRGGTYTVSVAKFGDMYDKKNFSEVDLGDEVYVGIYVCSHGNAATEKAVFRNLRLIRPARVDFVPYREYIGSDLELMDVATGVRRIIHHEMDSLQAPNWTPDGKTLILNHNGRMLSFDLKTRQPAPLDTGEQIRCNNDHCLTFDGKILGISSGDVSKVYTLPIGGGTPKLVTPVGPSYLHGFSPDGKTLVFTGARNGDYDIYSVSVEGGPETRLTNTKGLDDGSEFSPDGKKIYFNSTRTGRMQLWRMNVDGSEQEQLTFDDFNNWFAHISPDGKSIVFITYGPEIAADDHPFYKHVYLRQMPVTGGQPKVVAYLYGGQGSMNVNSWSPDSTTISFISNSDKL